MSNRLRPIWAGHLLLFEEKPLRIYDPKAGTALLLIFLLMEGIIGPRFSLLGLMDIAIPATAIRVPLLLILSLVLIRFVAQVDFSTIGLYSWKNWTSTERWYFFQVLILANVIFSIILFKKVTQLWTNQALWGAAFGILIIQLVWGFYQEFIYRGILQTELVRRWGTWSGIIVSNLFFTFGPLHFYHFKSAMQNPSHLLIFAGIFLIGLFFGLIFKRSGNLWMVGIFHGIGDWYIGGLQQVVSIQPP